MLRAAILHRSGGALAYPVGRHQLRLVLVAAAGDLAGAACCYNDRYAHPWETDSQLAMVREASDGIRDYWTVTIPMPYRRARYLFRLTGTDGEELWLSEAGLSPAWPRSYTPFHYAYAHPEDRWNPPAWLYGRTFYQVFLDRFHNGDPGNDPPGTLPWGSPVPKWPHSQSAYFGGDLAGLRQKLDHLDHLGVSGLYMTPIFQSPTNHKYDTTDYYQVDPGFGRHEDLSALVAECHTRDLRVLLDAVFNHSGDTWFAFEDVKARGPASPYWDWFFRIDGFPVTAEPCNYETFAVGLSHMPKLNTGHPELAEYLLKVAEHWLRTAGIDGWRLDVANEVDHRFWRRFRDRVKALRPDAWILGELWHDSLDWLRGDQYDAVMHYPWRAAVLEFLQGHMDAAALAGRLAQLRYMYPWPVLAQLLHLLGSHDTARVRTELGGSAARAAQATVLLLTGHGVPLIYYGDEIGMEGGPDPDCRGCMIWEPERWDQELFQLHRRLIHLRRRLPWLAWGGWKDLVANADLGLYAYRRESAGPMGNTLGQGPWPADRIWVALCTGPQRTALHLPVGDELREGLVDLVSGQPVPVRRGQARLTLRGTGAAVLVPAGAAAALLRDLIG